METRDAGIGAVDYAWLNARIDEIRARRGLESDNQVAGALRGGRGRAASVIRDIRGGRGRPQPATLQQLADLAGDQDDREWLERAGHVRPLRRRRDLAACDPLVRDVQRLIDELTPTADDKDLVYRLMRELWDRRHAPAGTLRQA